MAARRRYTEEDRAVALAAYEANANNLKRTARYCNIPINTLRRWLQGGETNAAVSQLRPQKKGDLAAALEAIAWQCVEAIPARMGEASLREVATTLGIAVEKMQLLRGKPTTINDDLSSLSDAELDRRIAEAQRRAAAPAGSEQE